MLVWQNEFKNAFKTTTELENFFDQKIPDTKFSVFLPPKFAQKIKNAGPNSPLWKQFVPSELENHSSGMLDPIGDQKFLVTKNLIHRYENRVLFLPTTNCPVACRYCFRKNELNDSTLFKSDLEASLNYIKNHPEINEIIFTGGDPFILSNEKILQYCQSFETIDNIKMIRFHTRTPTIIPSRIDEGLLSVLKELKKNFLQVAVMIHTNHVSELDNEVCEALLKLKETGVMLFSQTVLLNEVNDNENDLIELFFKLGTLGINPYYLHHPDQAYGTDHYQIGLERGRNIYFKLRKKLPGWLIPQYIIDIPGGHGKVSAFNPESLKFNGELLDINGELIKI